MTNFDYKNKRKTSKESGRRFYKCYKSVINTSTIISSPDSGGYAEGAGSQWTEPGGNPCQDIAPTKVRHYLRDRQMSFS